MFTFNQEESQNHDNEQDSSSIEDFAKSSKLIRMLRLWYPVIPNQHTFLQRFTLFKKLEEPAKSYMCVQDTFQWRSIEQLQLDPEHTELLNILKTTPNENQVGFCGKELTQEEFIFDPTLKTCHSRKNQALLMSGAQFTIEDQIPIYHYFFSHTFPYFYLTLGKFQDLMLKMGWARESLPYLFQAFKGKNGGKFLSYPEFISGLAACEPNTPHGDSCGEIRCRYIFKFYDKNHDGKLEFPEFTNMVKDIRKLRGSSTEDPLVLEEAENSAKVFGASHDSLLISDFLSGVGQLKFRGTSTLLRSPKSVLEILGDNSENSDSTSSGSNSPTVKRRKKEGNFDPLEFLQESVAESDVQEMSLGEYLAFCLAAKI